MPIRIAVVTLLLGLASAPAADPKLDVHGDPLPDGAVARLGTVRFYHTDFPGTVAYTPDGKRIVSSEWDGSLRVWDAETGRELRTDKADNHRGADVAVRTVDDPEIVVVPLNPSDPVRWWDVRRKAYTRTLEVPGSGAKILSPDGRRLAARTEKAILVFDLATGKLLASLDDRTARDTHYRERFGIAFVGNDRLAVHSPRGTIRVFDGMTGRLVRSIPATVSVADLLASADGRTLFTTEEVMMDDQVPLGHGASRRQNVVHAWDLEKGTRKPPFAVAANSRLTGISVSADGRVLAVAAHRPVGEMETTVWDVTTGKVLCVLDNRTGKHPALRPDGARLWVGGRVYEIPSGRRLWPVDAVHDRAAGLHLSPAGDRVVSVGYLSAGVWDGTTGRPVRPLSIPANVGGLERTVSPDGRFAVVYTEQELLLWDTAADRRQSAIRKPYAVTAFSPDSTLLAVRDYYPGFRLEVPVEIRRASDGSVVRSFATPGSEGVHHMAFTSDGATLIVVGEKAARYEVATGKELGTWPQMGIKYFPPRDGEPRGTLPIAVSADGELIAFRSARYRGGMPDEIGLLLYDGRTGAPLRQWVDDDRRGEDGPPPAFSPDGRLLATADGTRITLWETSSGRRVRSFDGHRGTIEGLAFSGNGRRLGSRSRDGTVLVWDVTFPLPAKRDAAAWWADLIDDDPAKAWPAVWHLIDAPDDVSLPTIRNHLKPATAADVDAIRKAIERLDHDRFAVRERATAELTKLGHMAGPALRTALASKPSPEAKQRIDGLLEKVVHLPDSGESLRAIRTLAALERKGTPEAKRLLKELANGADGAWLTAEAKAVLRRVP